MIEIVVAMDKNRGIGINNTLPWKLPRDMKHFVDLTTTQTILMGRKTYESIGKALPNRINLVLSSTVDDNAIFPAFQVKNLADFASFYKMAVTHQRPIMIIGGSNVYEQFLPMATKLHITRVHGEFECDAFFPEFENKFKLESAVEFKADEKNAYDMTFETYVRKN